MYKNLSVMGLLLLLIVGMAIVHPMTKNTSINANGATDFYQRHPDWTWANEAPNAVIPVSSGLDLSDYALRHPELSVSASAAVDTSDYFLRHPQLSISTGTAVDTSDYFFRHPELRRFAETIDTSDYFLRHPEFKTK